MNKEFRNLILVVICSWLLSGCANLAVLKEVAVENQRDAPFKGSVYNSISKEYIEQLTWVVLSSSEYGKAANAYTVRVERYGQGTNFAFIDLENIDRHIDAIDKYLKWEQTASLRGDLLNKDIATIPSKYVSNEFLYSFFSGNIHHHYLVIDNAPSFATKGMYAIYFDRKNALKLKKELEAFKAGKFILEEKNKIYS